MTTFQAGEVRPQPDSVTIEAARSLIRQALDEDLGETGDLTSQSTVPADAHATVALIARTDGVLCGTAFPDLTWHALSAEVTSDLRLTDGASVSSGDVVARFTGRVRSLLTGERTVLNLLCHLSGIASLTAQFVEQVRGTRAVILDTRKTLPGYRRLQKYAVRCGGGTNHRMGLFDGILIKDNHLAARGEQRPAAAVSDARNFLRSRKRSLPVEVEVDSLEQLRDVLTVQPDIVLLDNMPPRQLREAVSLRDSASPDTLLEASGGVTLDTVRSIAESGVDRISIGGLTHSAPALDLAFDWPTMPGTAG